MGAEEAGAREARSESEDEAFSRLAAGDTAGARSAMDRLLRQTLSQVTCPKEASYLVFDLLNLFGRQVSSHAGLPAPCATARLEMARNLRAADDTGELIDTFWSLWDQEAARMLPGSSGGHPAVDQVRDFVRQNYQRKLSLSEIAGAVGISRNYLSHLFRKHCGLTVTEHIHRTRMKQAEHLLLSGDRTVSEIAYMTGYQNYRDFHRNFVKYQRTSPKRFRQVRSNARRGVAAAST